MNSAPCTISTTGKVRTFKMNNDGKELVTGLYGAGRLFLGYMAILEGGRTEDGRGDLGGDRSGHHT